MYKPIKLSYQNDSLEPFIDTHTVGLHYYKHYFNYLNRLNELVFKNGDYEEVPLVLLNEHISKFPLEDRDSILYNLGGVLNHEVYFRSISSMPKLPFGKLKSAILDEYGSLDKMFSYLKRSALSLRGVGYTFLVIDKDKNLKIMNTFNQDSPYFYGYIPLIGIDMWEHAYYINYENKKDIYLDNFFEVLDFSFANDIYYQFTLGGE